MLWTSTSLFSVTCHLTSDSNEEHTRATNTLPTENQPTSRNRSDSKSAKGSRTRRSRSVALAPSGNWVGLAAWQWHGGRTAGTHRRGRQITQSAAAFSGDAGPRGNLVSPSITQSAPLRPQPRLINQRTKDDKKRPSISIAAFGSALKVRSAVHPRASRPLLPAQR
eukprot:4831183-Prymnesium_polylepis.1